MQDTRRVPSEHEEQCIIVDWARLMSKQHPKLSLLYSVPNGGQRHKAVAAKLKAEGQKSGVPDLVLPVARSGYHGLYIELKRVRDSSTSPTQKAWLHALNEEGYLAVVCKGADEAIKQIKAYLAI